VETFNRASNAQSNSAIQVRRPDLLFGADGPKIVEIQRKEAPWLKR
jgi:hypothetical protein